MKTEAKCNQCKDINNLIIGTLNKILLLLISYCFLLKKFLTNQKKKLLGFN